MTPAWGDDMSKSSAEIWKAATDLLAARRLALDKHATSKVDISTGEVDRETGDILSVRVALIINTPVPATKLVSMVEDLQYQALQKLSRLGVALSPPLSPHSHDDWQVWTNHNAIVFGCEVYFDKPQALVVLRGEGIL